jgi:hydroxymethylpyrimidine pyrophosphatase-like HAD family hydrolase
MTAPDSTVPERNLEAVRWFIANGGAFTLNTGRSIPMSLNHILGKIPTSAPLLLYNGSAAYDEKTGQFTRYSPIDFDPQAVLPALQAHFPHLGLEIQGVEAHYLLHKDAGWEAFNDHNHCPWAYAEPGEIPGPFIKFAVYGEFRDVAMSSMYEGSTEELDEITAATNYVMNLYGDKLEAFRACPRIVDFHAKGCSKLNSARMLQAELGRKILVCAGDGENDLTMLSGADYAYCPADAIIADRFENVCSCGEGAVADVIYRKIPEILKNKA